MDREQMNVRHFIRVQTTEVIEGKYDKKKRVEHKTTAVH